MNSIREFLINYYSLIDNSGLELTSNHLVGSIFPALVGGDVVITLPPLPGIGSGIAGLGVLISWWLLICYDLYKEKKEEENNQVVVNIVVYVDTRYIILFDHAEPSARYLTMLYSDVAHLWVPRPYPLWHEGTIHYGLRFDLNSFNMRFLSLMNPLLFETRVLTPAQIYSIRGFPLSELYFTMPMIAPSANVWLYMRTEFGLILKTNGQIIHPTPNSISLHLNFASLRARFESDRHVLIFHDIDTNLFL